MRRCTDIGTRTSAALRQASGRFRVGSGRPHGRELPLQFSPTLFRICSLAAVQAAHRSLPLLGRACRSHPHRNDAPPARCHLARVRSSHTGEPLLQSAYRNVRWLLQMERYRHGDCSVHESHCLRTSAITYWIVNILFGFHINCVVALYRLRIYLWTIETRTFYPARMRIHTMASRKDGIRSTEREGTGRDCLAE